MLVKVELTHKSDTWVKLPDEVDIPWINVLEHQMYKHEWVIYVFTKVYSIYCNFGSDAACNLPPE